MIDVREMIIEQLQDEGDLDQVAALEAESFTNPWTREMLSGELRGIRRAGLRPPLPGARVPPSAPAGSSSTSCTSTRWRWPKCDGGTDSRLALMRHILDRRRRRGVKRATLEVRRSNVAAQKLYERLGFCSAGVRPITTPSRPKTP